MQRGEGWNNASRDEQAAELLIALSSRTCAYLKAQALTKGCFAFPPAPSSAALQPARILDSPVLLVNLFSRRRPGTLHVACDATLGDTLGSAERALPGHMVESGIILS